MVMKTRVNQRCPSIGILLIKIFDTDVDKWFDTFEIIVLNGLEESIRALHLIGLSLLPKGRIKAFRLDLIEFRLQIRLGQMNPQPPKPLINRQPNPLPHNLPPHRLFLLIISQRKHLRPLLLFILPLYNLKTI